MSHPAPSTAAGTASVPCWVCGDTASTPWKARSIARPLVPADLQITDARYGETLALRRCGGCGFIFADDRDVAELVGLYEQLDDPGYEDTQGSRRLQMERLVERVAPQTRDAHTWLDIGAGAGLLVAAARARGFNAKGVEPSRSLVAAAERLNQVTLTQGTFPHPALAGETFDVISLVDVIEHVNRPVQLLSDCGAALAPGGSLLVVTPDISSIAARLLRRRWWHLRLAHVGYFDRRTLDRAAARAGLVPVHAFRPCWYFPIAYLRDRVIALLTGRTPSGSPSGPSGGGWVVPLNLFDSQAVLYRRR